MLEVEIKARLTDADPPALATRLAKRGFVPEQTVEERDRYYNGNDRDFRETDEALRLRSVRDLDTGAAATQITYKGPKQTQASMARLERETAVGDPAAMADILERLGYRRVLTVAKTRRRYSRGAITACLDEVAGLGAFLELEQLVDDATPGLDYRRAMAEAALLALLDDLGLPRHALTRRSYLEQLLGQ